jgi:hypothetical protein
MIMALVGLGSIVPSVEVDTILQDQMDNAERIVEIQVMKFIDCNADIVVYCTTDDDIEYRTSKLGLVWERRYGDSWETVWGDEEEQCIKAYRYWVGEEM